MNIKQIIPHIANLAAATADYETNWRTYANAPGGYFDHEQRKYVESAARTEANDRMRFCTTDQRTERDALIEAGLPAEVVHAIEAALVIAAARPQGIRPAEFKQPGGDHNAVAGFVAAIVNEGGVV